MWRGCDSLLLILQKLKFLTVFSPSLILVGEGFCFVRKPVWMGGKVRLRKEEGEGSHWLDYKAVRLHGSYYGAFFLDNQALIVDEKC